MSSSVPVNILRSLVLYSACPLAGLDEITIDHFEGLAFDDDLNTLPEVSGVVRSHWCLLSFDGTNRATQAHTSPEARAAGRIANGRFGGKRRDGESPATPVTILRSGLQVEDSVPMAEGAASGWHRSLASAVPRPGRVDRSTRPSRGIPPARPGKPAARFPLLVPESYLRRMRHGDVDDPLLRQVLPLEAELHDAAGFVTDSGWRRVGSRCSGTVAQVCRPGRC